MSEVVQNKVTENSVTNVVKPEGSLATITAEKIYADNPVATIIGLLNSFDRNWVGTAKQLAEELLASRGIECTDDLVKRVAKSIGQQIKNNLIQFNEMLNNRILTAVSKASGPKSYKLRLAPKAKLSETHKEILGAQSTEHVNHPSHYNQGGIECIDAIEESTKHLSGPLGFNIGNCDKYNWRLGLKNPTRAGVIEDLEKSKWYIERAIAYVKSGGKIFANGFGEE